MAKKIKMKPNKGHKTNKNLRFEQEAQEIIVRGEIFGDSIIGQFSLMATDPIGMGAATIGLVKAYAALKDVASRVGVDVESLFKQELPLYEGKFKELLDLEEMKSL